MNNTFFKKRMIFCIYRKTCQHVSGLVDDQSHESRSNTNIKEVHRTHDPETDLPKTIW